MLNIVFMGTPEFAIPCAELVKNEHNLLAIVTAPDKPAGRGHKLLSSPMKQWASQSGVLVLQPKNLKSSRFINQLASFNADLFVVVAFRMLPEVIWNMPPLGTINLHASLLPQFRGAAPIQRAIEAGSKITGLTTFRLTHKIDEGDIILQSSLHIDNDETGGQLYQRMMHSGVELMRNTLQLIESGKVEYQRQMEEYTSIAPKILSQDCEIIWEEPAEKVYNKIRAFIPLPGPWFYKDGKKYKIIKARMGKIFTKENPGTWHIDDHRLFIVARGGSIEILEIQVEGKRPMDVKSFINGLRK